MVEVDLFPDTPFPKEELKQYLLTSGESQHFVDLDFFNSRATSVSKDCGQIRLFCDDKCRLSISYMSHNIGGRERFRSDMKILKDILLETGGFQLFRCMVFFSSICDDLLPDVVDMLYNASADRHGKLHLSERDGALDTTVAVNIIESWTACSNVRGGQGASCIFNPRDISQHRQVLKTMFTKPSLISIDICTSLIGNDTLELLSSLLSSPSSSAVRFLTLTNVVASAESDRQLACIIETNKHITALAIGFDSDNWIASEMSRAVREANCTLGGLSLYPECKKGSLGHACSTEIDLYTFLNSYCGRGCMRSISYKPQKIPKLLERRIPEYLYPLLRENPSKWTSFLITGRDKKPTTSTKNRQEEAAFAPESR